MMRGQNRSRCSLVTPTQGTAVMATPTQWIAVMATPTQGTAVMATPTQGTAVMATPTQGISVITLAAPSRDCCYSLLLLSRVRLQTGGHLGRLPQFANQMFPMNTNTTTGHGHTVRSRK